MVKRQSRAGFKLNKNHVLIENEFFRSFLKKINVHVMLSRDFWIEFILSHVKYNSHPKLTLPITHSGMNQSKKIDCFVSPKNATASVVWSHLIVVGGGWSWLIVIDAERSCLIVIGAEWLCLIVIGVGWLCLIVLSAGWSWLIVNDTGWLRLIVITPDPDPDVVHGARMIVETATMMLMNMKINGLTITVSVTVDDHGHVNDVTCKMHSPNSIHRCS